MAASLGVGRLLRSCKLCGTFHVVRKRFSGSLNTHASNKDESATARQNDHQWRAVIGLEIHAQINSVSKLFSGAATEYGANTNTQVSFFDAALPGTLPVLNKRCVEAGVLTAIALGSDINLVSRFDRKHYFYADLPAGYQITQQRKPLAVNGHVTYVYQCSQTSRVERRSARLVQIQLEQDSGKSLHDAGNQVSLIDLNRAGVGLMEIVTAPDFIDGDDAASFVRDLRDILVTIGTCDGRMAEGSLRVDANISVHKPGEPLGTRTEVKNLNSLRSIRCAIEYEIIRQTQILENGGVVENETRSFDVENDETVLMRDKEKVLDYRFMPEPNLPPLVVHSERPSKLSHRHVVVLEDVKAMMKELPDMKRRRLENDYGVSLKKAITIVRAELTELFEILVTEYGCKPRAASSVLKNNYIQLLSDAGLHHSDCPVSCDRLADVIGIYDRNEINSSSVTKILKELAAGSQKTCHEIIKEQDLWAVKDDSLIMTAIDEVFSKNPKTIKAYKKGKTNQLDILQAKVMKKLDSKAESIVVRNMIKEKLDL